MITVVCRAGGFALVLAAFGRAALANTDPVAPEIDPGSIISGMTLLTGGFLILTNRARRR
jgi:hypothetical protein